MKIFLSKKKSRITKVVLTAIVSILILSFFISPTTAAQKVIDIKERNNSITIGPFYGTVYHYTGEFWIDQVTHSTYVKWDNGFYKFTYIAIGTFVDPMGNVILRGNIQITEVGNERTGLPFPRSCQRNQMEKCPGYGVCLNWHVGFTFDADGNIIEEHIILKY